MSGLVSEEVVGDWLVLGEVVAEAGSSSAQAELPLSASAVWSASVWPSLQAAPGEVNQKHLIQL